MPGACIADGRGPEQGDWAGRSRERASRESGAMPPKRWWGRRSRHHHDNAQHRREAKRWADARESEQQALRDKAVLKGRIEAGARRGSGTRVSDARRCSRPGCSDTRGSRRTTRYPRRSRRRGVGGGTACREAYLDKTQNLTRTTMSQNEALQAGEALSRLQQRRLRRPARRSWRLRTRRGCALANPTCGQDCMRKLSSALAEKELLKTKLQAGVHNRSLRDGHACAPGKDAGASQRAGKGKGALREVEQDPERDPGGPSQHRERARGRACAGPSRASRRAQVWKSLNDYKKPRAGKEKKEKKRKKEKKEKKAKKEGRRKEKGKKTRKDAPKLLPPKPKAKPKAEGGGKEKDRKTRAMKAMPKKKPQAVGLGTRQEGEQKGRKRKPAATETTTSTSSSSSTSS